MGLPAKMVIGGIASKLGGGDFASGALTAAFEDLYTTQAGAIAKRNASIKSGMDPLIAEMKQAGFELVTRELSVITESGLRMRVDGVFRHRDGAVVFGEAKFGPGTKYTANQLAGGLPLAQEAAVRELYFRLSPRQSSPGVLVANPGCASASITSRSPGMS